MMKFDTFFARSGTSEPRSAWMSSLCAVAESGTERETHENCRSMCAHITTRVYVSQKTAWEVVS